MKQFSSGQALFVGDTHYGKLQAKYDVDEQAAFLGTSNFDYHSNLEKRSKLSGGWVCNT